MAYREIFLQATVNDNDLWEIDTTSTSNVEYWGYATPGSLTSQAVWKLIKLTKDSNGLMIRKQFAEGSPAYIHIYDNRLSANYS